MFLITSKYYSRSDASGIITTTWHLWRQKNSLWGGTHSLLDFYYSRAGYFGGKFLAHKTWNTIEHVAQNQGKTTNRAQPLTPIFRINILQQGFTVKGSSAYTIKKWFLWLIVRLIVCGLRMMMNHLTSCWLVVACANYRTIP